MGWALGGILKAYNYNQFRDHFPGLPVLDNTPIQRDPDSHDPAPTTPTTPTTPPAPTPSKWTTAYKRLYESLYGKTDGDQSILSLYRDMFAEEDE